MLRNVEKMDPRRAQERRDSQMIREDHGSIANLPRQAIHHEFPRVNPYPSPWHDDLVHRSDQEDD